MRILFLSAEYPPDTDGIGAYVASVAPALSARGHDVHVLSCVPGQRSADDTIDDVTVHRRPRPHIRGLARALRSPSAAERLAQALACRREYGRLGWRADVVEAPDYLAEGLLCRRPLVAHLHTPVLLVIRHNAMEMDWNQRLGDRLERLAVRRADTVTAPSGMLVASLREAGWLPAGHHVDVIPYPVDLAAWERVGSAAGTQPVVLMVGRLEHRKAPDVLIEACATLRGSVDVEALFVGRSDGERDGLPYADWVRRRAGELGVRARFVDHIPRHQLTDMVAQSRAVAVPSRYDNYPMVVLEAMASGRPVVCSDAVGSGELVAGTPAGAVVPAEDPTALAAALLPYLEDADAAERAGTAARRIVRERCDPDRVAARREAVYARAAGR
jgi:glycogen synthase